jgi:hypothetical protein
VTRRISAIAFSWFGMKFKTSKATVWSNEPLANFSAWASPTSNVMRGEGVLFRA